MSDAAPPPPLTLKCRHAVRTDDHVCKRCGDWDTAALRAELAERRNEQPRPR